jgi:hypothetical protein
MEVCTNETTLRCIWVENGPCLSELYYCCCCRSDKISIRNGSSRIAREEKRERKREKEREWEKKRKREREREREGEREREKRRESESVRAYARTSEAKDCSQNANLHRPLMDMGMLEKS